MPSTIYWIGGVAAHVNDVNWGANWSGGSVPATGDTVYIEDGTYDLTTNLSSLSAVTLAALYISQAFTGKVGTTTAYWQIGATLCLIGYNTGNKRVNGSSLIRLNFGTAQTACTVLNSGRNSPLASGVPITLLGTHASNVLNVEGGVVSVANGIGEVSTFATIRNDGGTLYTGTGCTLTTIQNESTTILQSACTTLNSYGGTVTTSGTGAITTANIYAGTFTAGSSGTITNLNVYNANADFTQDPRTKTVTNCNTYPGSNVNLDNGVINSITFSNGIITHGTPAQNKITPWSNSTYAFS